jgi:cystathionine gamma-lyase
MPALINTQHAQARKQMTGFPGMLSFELKGGEADARKFLRHLRIFALAESLGGVESLIEHPATMTHASVPAGERRKIGVNDSLIRISVGIENHEDLVGDIERALGII